MLPFLSLSLRLISTLLFFLPLLVGINLLGSFSYIHSQCNYSCACNYYFSLSTHRKQKNKGELPWDLWTSSTMNDKVFPTINGHYASYHASTPEQTNPCLIVLFSKPRVSRAHNYMYKIPTNNNIVSFTYTYTCTWILFTHAHVDIRTAGAAELGKEVRAIR